MTAPAAGVQSGSFDIADTPTSLSELIDVSADESTEVIRIYRMAAQPLVIYGDESVEHGATPGTDPPVSGVPFLDDSVTDIPVANLSNVYVLNEVSVPPATLSWARLH